MLTSPTANLVTRDAIPRDAYAVTQVLTAALAASPQGGWLEPDPRRRGKSALGYLGPLVVQTIRSGIVRLAEQDGVIVAAALWSLHSGGGAPDAERAEVVADVHRCWAALDRFADTRRPRVAHQQLVFLGVRPDRRGQGVGSHLLIGHHALLHVTGTPAYAVAVDAGTRDVFARHGYTTMGAAERLSDGVMAWAMWRPPGPADPTSR